MSQKIREVAQEKARKYRNDHNASQGDQALGLIAAFTAAAGGIAGAIAMPVLYATNFGVGISLAFTGAVIGLAAGAAVPYLIHKAAKSETLQYLKPSTYKQAFKKG
jgi:membrane associated rhomboid family serine protease